MATLKDIWDYPNNPDQGMVADTANWSSTNAFGVSQRVEALRSGAYRTWPVSAISPATLGHSTLDISKKIAGYINYTASHGDDTNLTFNQITKYPLVEWQPVPLETYPKITTLTIKVDSTTKKGVLEVTTNIEPTSPTLANGDSIYFKYLKDDGRRLFSRLNVESGTTYWPGSAPLGVVKRIDATHYELWEAGLASPKEIEGVVVNQDNIYAIKYTEGNNETLLCFEGANRDFVSGDILTLAEGFANGYSIAGGEGTAYYLTKIAENRFSLFTNVERTTGAVLTGESNFTKTKVGTTTTNATHAITGLNISGAGFATLRAELAAQAMNGGALNGWCRVKAVATDGASISFPGQSIPTTITTDSYFGYNYQNAGTGSDSIDIYEDIGTDDPVAGGYLEYTQSGGGTVTVTIEFVSFLNSNQDGGNFVATNVTTGVVNSWANGNVQWIEGLNSHAEFCKIWIPGMEKYTFQNTSNVTTAGANIDFTKRWRENAVNIGVSEMTAQPIATVDVDASGYLTGLTITNEGTFPTNANTNPPRVHVITAKPDTYVTPTPYAPDVFDTDDEWDTISYEPEGLKIWPTTVRPNGFKVTNSTPASVSRSQNGTKYVRSSGVIRSQLEVSYPPMTYDQFREYEVCAQAARGQTTPFFLRCRWPAKAGTSTLEDLIFQRTDSDNASLPGLLRTRNPVAIGDKTLVIEGFAAGATNAFIRGETVIFNDGSGNGFLVKVVNNTDSNIFGEAKIRIPLGSRKAIASAETLNKNPFHVVVTLAEDDLEYNLGTDGLYRLSVTFDFDEWK